MFLQHTQDIKVVFDEESILDLVKKHIESVYYETRYGSYQLISSEVEITDERKPLIKLRYQKIEKTIDDTKKDKADDDD
jgi:hypothetical protein